MISLLDYRLFHARSFDKRQGKHPLGRNAC